MKDSALTIHGSLQAERLGKFLAKTGLHFAHIFSSDLQRAFKTATAIRTWSEAARPENKLAVTALQILREQDFGFYEGKPFYARPRDSNKSGKEAHRSRHHSDPDFQDVESKEAMAERMEKFLRDHLIPIIKTAGSGQDKAIAIVSHGIILSHLWRCFLRLLPKNSVTLKPGLSVGTGGVTPLEYLGGWSNTGYLELDVQKRKQSIMGQNVSQTPTSPTTEPRASEADSVFPLQEYKVIIKTVNGKEHLQGLKRTKGGVGSSKYDESQKPIDSFFKKRKVIDSLD